jgi:uncharacterized membrane protein YkvA (DUF1232 family)
LKPETIFLRLEKYQTENMTLKNLDKIKFPGMRIIRKIGQQATYIVLLLYYAFNRKDTPRWAKHIIFGAFAYLLSPVDAIPDLTPIIGYTDDIGVLAYGLVAIAAYINDNVRIEARKKLKKLFGELDFEAVQAVEKKL